MSLSREERKSLYSGDSRCLFRVSSQGVSVPVNATQVYTAFLGSQLSCLSEFNPIRVLPSDVHHFPCVYTTPGGLLLAPSPLVYNGVSMESPDQYVTRCQLFAATLSATRLAVKAFMDSQRIQYVTLGMSGGILALTTSAGGIINNVIPLDFSSAIGESSYASIFDEYQMVGATVKFTPSVAGAAPNSGAGLPNLGGHFVSVVDLDSNAALTSLNQAGQYDSHKSFTIGDSSFSRWIAKGIPDRDWISTTGTVVNAWWKIFSSALTATSTYGYTDTWLMVRFRMTY
jgi:hypothetical protein